MAISWDMLTHIVIYSEKLIGLIAQKRNYEGMIPSIYVGIPMKS